MLKFFFHRDSKFVRGLEACGLLLIVAILFSGRLWDRSAVTIIFFVIYLLEYLFIRFCIGYNWYKKYEVGSKKYEVRKELGIALHFKKARVPTSYILVITNACILLGFFAVVYVSAFLLAVVVHVNVILIYLHLKDKLDPTPPNFFSGTK